MAEQKIQFDSVERKKDYCIEEKRYKPNNQTEQDFTWRMQSVKRRGYWIPELDQPPQHETFGSQQNHIAVKKTKKTKE